MLQLSYLKNTNLLLNITPPPHPHIPATSDFKKIQGQKSCDFWAQFP